MIIAQPKEQIADFVGMICGYGGNVWRDYSTLALITGERLIAGCVYHRWSEGDVCVNIGVIGRLTPEYLHAIFDYPFQTCRRITVLVSSNNFRSKRFVEHLGFTQEGRLRCGAPDGDLLVFGMLKEECRWINLLKKAA